MSKEDLSPHCKQRFKGIENFLRRVAFNLGNTPSQTEVKIISCIPIDVSDLQQKILNLEKQLNETTVDRGQAVAENNTSCAAALYATNYRGVSNNDQTCNDFDCVKGTSPLEGASKLNFRTSPRNDSTESFIAGPSTGNCYCNSDTSLRQVSNNQSQPLIICEPQREKRRNFFRKKKKLPKKRKVKSQFVYYAQTSNAPFTDTNKWNVLDEMETNTSGGMTRSYLADMIRKQYRPKNFGCNISDISKYSSPVCRDTPQEFTLCPYESDVCSCCHGPFHNIDNQRSKEPLNDTTYLHETNRRSSYYDSRLYDLVPVKEKPGKTKKDLEVSIKKTTKPQVDVECWAEEPRSIIPRFRPFIVNYHTIRPDYHATRNEYIKNIPRNLKKRDAVTEKIVSKRKRATIVGQTLDMVTSKSCCVEFGNVYAKKKRKQLKTERVLGVPQPQRKNAECLTTAINNTECQTVTSNPEVKKNDVKTEATLNQIKSILQSVLTEVKTNNQIKTTSEDKPKRDAVVQKGASQSNLQGSTFLNSFTYSPYNMNSYIASRSQQINSCHLCYPQSMKYLQNFPLIIQSGRHVCNGCYKNNSHSKSMHPKQATTASTNTDEVTQERSKETEKLIKEIYKSIALNANLLKGDESYSEYENMKSIHEFENEMNKKSEVELPRNAVRAISEVFIKTKTPGSSERKTSSKYTSNTIRTNSQSASTYTEKTDKKDNRHAQSNRKESVSVSTVVENRALPEEDLDVITAGSELSSSDVESDATYVPEKDNQVPQVLQKNENKSFFSKMFKSVFKTRDKPKKTEFKVETESESTSDSDDYQTIYSQKVDKPKYRTRAVNLTKQKTHSKISNSKKNYRDRSPERFRRSPYMEQEYRRHWNERLTFDKQGKIHSTERPVSKNRTPQKPIYYQNYEARAAVVEPREPYCPRQCARDTGKLYFRSKDPGRPYYGNNNCQNRSYIQKDKSHAETKLESKGAKGLAWLKKHKMGMRCGEQWKKLILEG